MVQFYQLFFLYFFLYVAFSPWIDDGIFTGNDAKRMLKERGFLLNDKIKLLSNESGGLRDYFLEFNISISKNDYEKIKNQIISQQNYLGKKDFDFTQGHTEVEINKSDTIAYENENYYTWDEISKNEHGHTTHYYIQLDKHKYQLSFDEDD